MATQPMRPPIARAAADRMQVETFLTNSRCSEFPARFGFDCRVRRRMVCLDRRDSFLLQLFRLKMGHERFKQRLEFPVHRFL
jgi:hypothetical protein